MATLPLIEVIQRLRCTTALVGAGADQTDGQLLDRFIDHQDEMALEAIVHRHGPMVWGVCRRVLGDRHDAEDAFQATFLVLVRKAASIVPREMVANWLYGVAHQTAVKARAMTGKRRAKERQVTEMPEPEVMPPGPDLWLELRPVLDQELSRLPDKYRVPIVLCDLEGKARKEVARQLGWPEGTLSGRLARARKMLASRLARRGVVLTGGLIAMVLSENAVSASVPVPLMVSTIKAASLFAAGQAAGVVSAPVVALTEGVLKAMFLTKCKIATAVLLTVGLLFSGAGLVLAPANGADPVVKKKIAQAKKVGDKNNGNGQQGDKDDGKKGDKDDGQKGNKDDGQKGNKDDGQKGDKDDGQKGNKDDGKKKR